MRPVPRAELLEDLVARCQDHPRAPNLRIGIDGVTAGGKSKLAKALSQRLRAAGQPVLRATMDGFHHSREMRYRQGADSIKGYMEDSFQFDAVRNHLLRPLSANGNRHVRRQVYSLPEERSVDLPPEEVPVGTTLVFEGVFALHPTLRPHYDLMLYVHCDEEEILRRGRVRDAERLGGAELVEDRYQRRYLPGQRQFHDDQRLRDHVHLWIDNTHPARPRATVSD